MTKEKLQRLMDLWYERGTNLPIGGLTGGAAAEFDTLQAEFEAWEPELAFQSANKEAGMWEGAAKLALEQAQTAERQRDEAREKAEAVEALVYRIGLRLRQHYRDEHDGWTPGAAYEIYRWIDQLAKETDPEKEKAGS